MGAQPHDELDGGLREISGAVSTELEALHALDPEAKDRKIQFPLLSDFGREVVEEYGVKHEAGFPERAYFVIDKEGVVRARKIEDSPGDQPEVEDVLDDLNKALQQSNKK